MAYKHTQFFSEFFFPCTDTKSSFLFTNHKKNGRIITQRWDEKVAKGGGAASDAQFFSAPFVVFCSSF